MSKFCKILCLVLAVLMISAVFVACGNEADKGKDKEKDPQVTPKDDPEFESGDEEEGVYAPNGYDNKGYVKDTIPEGTTFTDDKGTPRDVIVICGSEMANAIFPRSINESTTVTATIENEIYNHILRLEMTYGVDFQVTYKKASYQTPELLTTVKNMGTTGDAFDLVASYSLWPPAMATAGLLNNLENYEYPQLMLDDAKHKMPWWPSTVGEWSQQGATYYVASNSSYHVIHSLEVLYAYLAKLEDVGVTNLLDDVIAGDWTMEKLKQYTALFASDEPDDTRFYGLVVDDFSRCDGFYYGNGFNCTRNGSNGEPYLAFVEDEQLISDWIDFMNSSFFSKPECYIDANTCTLMTQKRTAFMLCSLGNIVTATQGENDYAAVPIPKYEDQEEYRATNNNGYDLYAIPVTATEPEEIGIIIEAMASSYYRNIAPSYYEKTLKNRYAVDEQGRQIFDIIRASGIREFGRVNEQNLGGCEHFRSCLQTGENDYSTWLAQKKGTFETKLLQTFADMKKYVGNA